MRRILFLSIALAMQSAVVTATAQETRVASEAIPAQPLDRALNDLSRQTGLQFVYNAQQAGNPRTRPMPAGLAPQQALEQLLDGTGLRYRYLNDTTVTIEARSDAMPAGTSSVSAAAPAVALETTPAAEAAALQQPRRLPCSSWSVSTWSAATAAAWSRPWTSSAPPSAFPTRSWPPT